MSDITYKNCPTCGDKKVVFSGRTPSEFVTCKKCGKVFCDKCGRKYGYESCPGCYSQHPRVSTSAEQEAKSKGCFVATATFGSYSSPEVVYLSAFRDELLVRNLFGRLFIRIYYATAPFLASVIVKSELLRLLTRSLVLAPIIRGLKLFFEPEVEG